MGGGRQALLLMDANVLIDLAFCVCCVCSSRRSVGGACVTNDRDSRRSFAFIQKWL